MKSLSLTSIGHVTWMTAQILEIWDIYDVTCDAAVDAANGERKISARSMRNLSVHVKYLSSIIDFERSR